MARYKLYTQPRKISETIDKFISRLRELSVKCQFGAMNDELMWDQRIVQCNNKKIQERLWATKNPTRSLAKVVEQSEDCVREMQKDNSAYVSHLEHEGYGQ